MIELLIELSIELPIEASNRIEQLDGYQSADGDPNCFPWKYCSVFPFAGVLDDARYQ